MTLKKKAFENIVKLEALDRLYRSTKFSVKMKKILTSI